METNRIARSGQASRGGLIPATICLAILGSAGLSPAQSPVVPAEVKVVAPPQVREVGAEIIPLVWRANIGTAVTSVLLSKIENYGIQDYQIDGNLLVRELTITTSSRSMIRIYHVLPLGAIDADAANLLNEQLEKIKRLREGQDRDLPFKTYPVTTHEKMVEYRVSKPEDIDALYASLDRAMTTHLGRELVPEQRGAVVESVTIGKGE